MAEIINYNNVFFQSIYRVKNAIGNFIENINKEIVLHQ